MRITNLRVWLNHAVRESVGAARRVGHAIHRRIKSSSDKVEVGVGIGDDESGFGGGRTQVWLEWLDDARDQVLRFFEKSTFERFPRFEKFMRRLLGKQKPALDRPQGDPQRPDRSPGGEAFGRAQRRRSRPGSRPKCRRPSGRPTPKATPVFWTNTRG
jgi:hypothetical protein